MPITDIVPLIQSHAWVPLAALVIGFLVRALKSDAFVLPPSWVVAARWRPVLVVALGLLSGVLEAVVGGAAWRDAIVGGLLSALLAMLGHTTIVDLLRGGRDIGAAPEKGPLYAPPPAPPSDEVTLPRGPRGVATIEVVTAIAGALVVLALVQVIFGCSWLKAQGPTVVHVVRAIEGACTGYAIVVPDVGPVCLALSQIDQILEDVLAAKRDGVAYHLTVEIDGVERSVTIPPEQLAAFAAHVGQVAASGHAAPAASGSAGAR